MSDQLALLLVLIAIYLSECFVWVGYGAVVFRSLVSNRCTPLDPPIFPGNDRGGWALLNPLPPFGVHFVCHQWPLALSKEQVGPPTAQSINFKTQADYEAVVMPWQAAAKLETTGRKLSLAGVPMMRMPDEPAANHFRKLLAQIAAAAPENRDALITRALADSFDTKAIESRVEQFWRSTWLLRTLCTMMFVLLFVLVPVAFWLGRFTELVYRLLPLLAATWLSLLVCFYVIHRRLLPVERLARWKGLVMMLFAPTATIRACDTISRHLMVGADPVALASVVCTRQQFAAFATRARQDLRWPLAMNGSPQADADGEALAESFRQRLIVHVEAVMKKQGVDPSALDAPPVPEETSMQVYCPRCRLQYMVPGGTCRDCGELALERLPEGKRAEAEVEAVVGEVPVNAAG